MNTKLMLEKNDFKIKFGSKQCGLNRENQIGSPPASCNFQLPKKVYKEETIRYLSCTGKRETKSIDYCRR